MSQRILEKHTEAACRSLWAQGYTLGEIDTLVDLSHGVVNGVAKSVPGADFSKMLRGVTVMLAASITTLDQESET